MTERRTELIRVRVTPSEKASWEAAAVREDKSVSELIRSAIDQRISLNDRLGATVAVPVGYGEWVPRTRAIDALLGQEVETELAISNVTGFGPGGKPCQFCDVDEEGATTCVCALASEPEAAAKLRETFGPKPDAERKSWMFEARGE